MGSGESIYLATMSLDSRGQSRLPARLHHRLAERLPAPMAAKLRELRAAWYDRKLPSATELP